MSTSEIKERYTCFDLLGEAAKKVAGGYLYRCPWREDAHPSLSVSNDGRGWHDFATGEHGSIIDLALKVWNTSSVSEVCSRFGEKTLSFPQPSYSSFRIFACPAISCSATPGVKLELRDS